MRNRETNRDPTQTKSLKDRNNVQTTLRLPAPLYEQAKSFVEGLEGRSVNGLIVNALTAYLRAAKRKRIDDAFKPMIADRAYQREALKIAEQFAASDEEAIELSERDLAGL
jgi:hypothetical protein